MNKYDSAGCSPSKATSLPRNPGPIDTVNDTLRLAREVADRASYLVGRVCGHVPTGVAAAEADQPSNGLLYDMAAAADMTRQRLLAALDELTRLENTIGV